MVSHEILRCTIVLMYLTLIRNSSLQFVYVSFGDFRTLALVPGALLLFPVVVDTKLLRSVWLKTMRISRNMENTKTLRLIYRARYDRECA